MLSKDILYYISSMIGKQFGLTNIMLHKDKSDGQYKKTADNSLFKKYYPDFKFKSFEEGIKILVIF